MNIDLTQRKKDMVEKWSLYAEQRRALEEQCRKLEQDARAGKEQEDAVAQQLVEQINNLPGFKYQLVPKDDDDGYETVDEMEKQWRFNKIGDFLGNHQCVFVTNTTTREGKKLVFALFPGDTGLPYLATDIVAAQTLLSITKLIRESSGGVFNIMTIKDNLKISVPQHYPKHTKLMSTYCGSVQPTQQCARGCDFCKTLFTYDNRRVMFGNHHPVDDDDDEEAPKKRAKPSPCDE
jgi:hypothetical protein